jgi:hypothetical protein
MSLTYPVIKKLSGVISGERGGHGIGPSRQTQRSLLSDDISNADYLASDYFIINLKHLPEGCEENKKGLLEDSRCSGRDLTEHLQNIIQKIYRLRKFARCQDMGNITNAYLIHCSCYFIN